jgi:hypothetical protein
MTYKKPEVKIYADVPTAGGCGDWSESMCKAMAYKKQGPGCGDWAESMCKQQAYKK